MNVKFNPDSWDKAAKAFTAAAGDLAQSNPELDAGGSATETDHAVDEVRAKLLDEFTKALRGITEGLHDDSATMTATAAAYRAQEDANEAGAKNSGER